MWQAESKMLEDKEKIKITNAFFNRENRQKKQFVI